MGGCFYAPSCLAVSVQVAAKLAPMSVPLSFTPGKNVPPADMEADPTFEDRTDVQEPSGFILNAEHVTGAIAVCEPLRGLSVLPMVTPVDCAIARARRNIRLPAICEKWWGNGARQDIKQDSRPPVPKVSDKISGRLGGNHFSSGVNRRVLALPRPCRRRFVRLVADQERSGFMLCQDRARQRFCLGRNRGLAAVQRLIRHRGLRPDARHASC